MGLVNLSQQLLVRVIFCLDFGGHGCWACQVRIRMICKTWNAFTCAYVGQ